MNCKLSDIISTERTIYVFLVPQVSLFNGWAYVMCRLYGIVQLAYLYFVPGDI